MNFKKVYSSLLMVSVLTLTACNNSSSSSSIENIQADVELNLSLNLNKASQTISENIYGTFIEHIEKCIYNGIWSELILDRKFVAPIGEDVSQWKKVGDVISNTKVTMNDTYSVELKQGTAITQNGIALDKDKSYDGYFYAQGNGKVKVTYSYSGQKIEKEIDISSNELKKYEYQIYSTVRATKYKVEFACEEGNVILDSLSLMPSDNIYGMRKETLDVLKELNAPFYRWPGGNFVSGYSWEDGIGDRDYRKTERNLNYLGQLSDFENDDERLANDLVKIGSLGFYGAFEPNDYGLDEFIQMCRYLDAEPNIVVNSGFGSASEAANEVAYCNTTNTEYGNKRPSQEPYNVKYFSIGNEMNGDWQLGHVDIKTYTKRHTEFYNAMVAVDPTIKIIGVGDNHTSWSREMLENCEMDYISEHFYAERDESDPVEHIKSIKKQAEYRIGKHRELNTDVKMCIDEYAYMNAECDSRLKDGMGVALGLNTFIKNSDVVEIACYSSTVNATQGSVSTDRFNAYLEGNGWALKLYRENLLDIYCPASYRVTEMKDYAFEIIVTTNKEKNQIALAIVNSSDKVVELINKDFKKIVERRYVTANFLDDYESEENQAFKYIIDNPSQALIEPQSITTLLIQL